MDFSEFWLQSNNGKKMSLQNLKELKKSDLEGNNALIRIFNIFDTQNADGTKGSDGVLNKEELTSLFNTMQKAAQSSKGKDTSIFETEEAEDFINSTQTSDGKTLKEIGIKATDMFEFLSKLVKTQNAPLTVHNLPTNVNLTEEQAQEEVISTISNDAAEARTLLMKQDNGVVSDLYNKYKELRDDDLSLSNIEEAVVLQQEGADNLYKAKEGKLSKREYFLQNREHLKTMMKRRLFRKDEKTGLDFLDRNRGTMTKEKFAKFMEEYINEQIDKIDKLDSLKNIQHTLFVTTDAGVEQMLKNYKKGAEEELLHNPVAEQRLIKIKTPKIPQEFDTTEPMTFEEVFKFERNQEYSKDKVEDYLRQKQKTDFATGAYNKYQSFKMASDEFLEIKQTNYGTYGAVMATELQPNPEKQAEKVIELFTAYYDNPFKPNKAKEELERLISENNLPISVITKEDGLISLDLSRISNDNQKNRILNQLVKLEGSKLKEQLEQTLGGDIEEKLTSISSQTQCAYTNAYGQDFTQELAQEMADDNKTFIQKYTGNTSMAGMGLTVVGGILCFTPAAALGAGMVTVGNTLAIGGMVAESGLGYTEALTRSSLDEEEIKELSKTLVMNAGGFVIGMQAGKTGMKAFNKLIDKKLAEVFKTEMVKGNRAEALKQVFTNPEYLKNFMQAAGVKLSADFIISYAGDLAMMGVLDTQDDWQSLLQANLIGIMAGMGGDIKEAAHLGMKGDRYRALSKKENQGNISPTEANELAALKNDPDIQQAYPDGIVDIESSDRTILGRIKDAIISTKTYTKEDCTLVRLQTDDVSEALKHTIGDKPYRIATSGYSNNRTGYEETTLSFLTSMNQALGGNKKTAYVAPPTLDEGSIYDITSRVSGLGKDNIMFVTTESFWHEFNDFSRFRDDVDMKKYSETPVYSFPDIKTYLNATANASNVLVCTGGRNIALTEIVEALKRKNKVVLLINKNLLGDTVDSKTGIVENGAVYFENLSSPDWAAKLDLPITEWLDNDYIRTHMNRVRQLVRVYVVDSDESTKFAGQRAANFIKSKTLYDFWPEDVADNYGLTDAEIAAAKIAESHELDIDQCAARYAAQLAGTGTPTNEKISPTEAGHEHSAVQKVSGQDEQTTSIETSTQNNKKIRVGVIDVFGEKRKGIAINGVEKDFSHGELVKGALQAYVKDQDVEVIEFSVKTSDPKKYNDNGKVITQSGKSNLQFNQKSFLKELKKLNALPEDQKLDYLNISSIIQLDYKVNGRDITPEDLTNPEIRAEIRASLPKSVEHILQELEKLISNGTEIYLSAGNRRNTFNAMSLAKGIHTIGGKNLETNQPLSYFTNNALVEEHVGLPLYFAGAKGSSQVMEDSNIKGVKMSGIINQQSPFSKLSKWELSKKIATNADYAELKQYADKLIAEGKKKIDINFFQYSFAFTVPEKFRYKIYDTQRFISMFEGHLEPEVIEYIKPMGTHCDIQYRQFFDMKAKEGHHIMPMSKTTAVRNTVSGTSFAPGQAIAEKIKKEEN